MWLKQYSNSCTDDFLRIERPSNREVTELTSLYRTHEAKFCRVINSEFVRVPFANAQNSDLGQDLALDLPLQKLLVVRRPSEWGKSRVRRTLNDIFYLKAIVGA